MADTMEIGVQPETLADAVTVLRGKIKRLFKDIGDRQANIESNLRLIAKKTGEEIEQLRGQYDSCLNRGDKVKADKYLDQIASVRKKLVTLAKNVAGTSDHYADLENRASDLHKEVLELSQKIRANFLHFRELDKQAAGLLDWLSISIGRDINQLKDSVGKAKKIAEQILAE